MAFGSKNRVRVQTGVDGVKESASELGKFRGAFEDLSKNKGVSLFTQGIGLGAGIGAWGALSGAVSGVVDVLVDSVQKAEEEQAGIDRLDASLKANVKGWDGNRDAIEKVIASREKLAFSDGEQRDSLALLVTRTHDSTKALALEREAMDLARLKGISLADASEIIGKVYGGNVAILKRYGIEVTKGATSTEALAQIQKAAAGQAEAYGNTTQGTMESLQIAMDDLQEEVGTALLPVLKELAAWARDDLVPALSDSVKWIDENKGAFEVLGKAVEIIVKGPFAVAADEFQQQQRDSADAAIASTAATKIAYESSSHEMGKSFDFIEKKSGTAADAVKVDQRAIRWDFKKTSDYLLQDYTTNFDTAMGIVEARSALHVAKTDQDKAQAYADLAKLGALSKKDYADWIATLERLAKNSKGKVHTAYVNAIADIRRLKAEADANIDITVSYSSQGSKKNDKGKASGGYVPGGWSGPVNEESGRSEWMHLLPGGGAYITNRDQAGGMNGGGGGKAVVIQLQLDGREIARVVDRNLYYEAARAPQSTFGG